MASSRVTVSWLGAALGAGVLAGGLPFWAVPYSDIAVLASPLPVWWAVAVSIAAGAVSYASPLGVMRSAVPVALGVPAAVLVRVVVESAQDPTTHNLWPLEVMLSLAVVVLPAFGGAYIGDRLQRPGARSQTIR